MIFIYQRDETPGTLWWRLTLGSYEYLARQIPGEVCLYKNYRKADTSLEKLLDLARGWLTTCRSNHKHCVTRPLNESGFLPTRLLDVGLPGQQSIRIVNTYSLRKTRGSSYITLSYR